MRLTTNQHILTKARSARRERFMRRLLWMCSGIVVLLLIIVYALRLSSFQIKQVSVTGTFLVSREAVESIVADTLQGNIAGVIPRSNFLLYSRESLRERLLGTYIRIAAVTFTEASPQSLIVTIHERTPEAVWCEGIYIPQGERVCLYMDQFGLPYDQAPQFSAPIYFEFYGYEKTLPKLGEHVANMAVLSQIKTLRTLLAALQIAPVAVTLQTDGTFQLMTNKGWWLIVDTATDPILVVDHLQAALSAEVFKKRLVDTQNRLEYIDLRFGKKVFYKFMPPEEATSTRAL